MSVFGLLLLSVVLAGFGQVCLKIGVDSAGDLSLARLAGLLRAVVSPLVVLGFLLYAVSATSWLVALSRTSLSYAYPFTALTLALVMTLSWLILREPLSVPRAAGVALICLGLVVASR